MGFAELERNFAMVKSCKKGFTLIEVMIVVSITVLLSGLVFASYKDSQKRYSLAQAVQKLASDIRRVQNMTISGKEIVGVCESGASNCYGYGIYMEEEEDDSYKIYADWNNDHFFKGSDDAVVETIYLPGVIRIQSASPGNELSIFFEPPDPTTYIDGSSGASVEPAEIVLEVVGSPLLTKTVTVTSSGLIGVE